MPAMFAALFRVPDASTLELFAGPGLFFAVLGLCLVAGLRWHASLAVTALALVSVLLALAAQQQALTPETSIGAAVAAMLLIAFWKLRPRGA